MTGEQWDRNMYWIVVKEERKKPDGEKLLGDAGSDWGSTGSGGKQRQPYFVK